MPFDPSQPFEEVKAFDPSQPYEEVAVAEFDPNQPFEVVEEQPEIAAPGKDAGKGRVMSGLAQAGQSLYEGIGTAITGLATVGRRIDEARLGGDEAATRSELKSLQSTIAKAEEKGLEPTELKERARALEGGLRSFGQAETFQDIGEAARGVGERFEPNPKYADEFWAGTAPQVAGSAGASLAQLATGAGPALLFGQAYQATLERNLAKGTSATKAHGLALREGIISGGLESVGTGIVAGIAKRMAGKLATPSRLKDATKGVVAEFLTGSAQESTSELIDEEKLQPLKIIKAGGLEALGAGMVIAPAIGIGKIREAVTEAPQTAPIIAQSAAIASGDLSAAAQSAQDILSTPPPDIGAEPEATALPDGPISGGPTEAEAVETPAISSSDVQALPFGPGKMTVGELPPQGKVGAYNDAVDAQREQRGRPPLMSGAREANPVTWDKAVERIEENPDSPEQLVERIREDPKAPVSRDQQAELLWRLTDLRNKLELESERAADPDATPQEQILAQERAEGIERQLQRTEEADRIAGTAEGAALQFRQVLANEDFTFGGMMRKERKLKGAPLTADERAVIKEQADNIAALEKTVSEEKTRTAAAEADAALKDTYEAQLKEAQVELEKRPTFGKQVLDIARAHVERAKIAADEARARMRARRGQSLAGIPDPTLIYDLAVIIKAKIYEFGLNFIETRTAMRAEFGDDIDPHLQKAWVKAQGLIDKETAPPKVKEAIKAGAAKPKKAAKGLKARAKAEASAELPLSHKLVHDLGRQHIEAGVRGEAAVAKAIHDDIKEFYPDATERDVRRAYVEYGKEVKPPNPEEVATHARLIGSLFKVQEDIDRLNEGLGTWKSQKREKAVLQLREKMAERAELLKRVKAPPTEDQLASRDQARQTQARNAIEALDEQLRTGKERIKREPAMPSAELEQLQSELEAMRELKSELDQQERDARKTPETEAQKALNEAAVAKERIEQRLNDISEGKMDASKPEAKGALTQLEEDMRLEAEALHQLANEMAREIRAARHPVKAEHVKQLDALEKQEKELVRKIAAGEVTPKTGRPTADTAEIAAAKERLARLRKKITEMRRAQKPKTDPEVRREEAQLAALKKAITRYDEALASRRLAPAGRRLGPDASRVAALRSVRDSRAAALKAARMAGRPIESKTERYNRTRLKAVEKRLKETKERIDRKDFERPPRRTPPEKSRPLLQAEGKLLAAKREFEAGLREKEARAQPWYKKGGQLVQEARGIILGSDIGVLTRQGLFSWARPIAAARAAVTATRAAFSPESMNRWEVEVRDREINGELAAPKRKAAGLQTTDTLTHSEELVITRLLSRLPDVKIGGKTVRLSAVGRTFERFQTTFINAVRTDLFDAGIANGYTPLELQNRANFINSATGRSNLRYVPPTLNVIMTSPRYEASRWELIAAPIRNIRQLARQGVRGELDRGSLANLQDMAVTAVSIFALFKIAEAAAGYKVEWDPEKSDFLKMRRGDEVWDVSAGLAPRLRDLIRLYVAFTHPGYNKNLGKTLLGAGLRTINPALKTPIDQAGIAVQKLRGVEEPKLPFTGFKADDERTGLITMAPLIVQSMNEVLKEEGAGAAAWTGAREFVGLSVQRYPAK